MENKRLRHVVKALYRRCASTTSVVDDAKATKKGTPRLDATMATVTPAQTSLSPPLSVLTSLPAPSSSPLPTSTSASVSELRVGRGRSKRPKAWETSTHPTNDLCEVCAEQPPRKKELLFGGCLHGMCRLCMTAHLKARRRCCHVCQVDFQDRLLEVGVQVTIKHVLAESEKRGQTTTPGSKRRGRPKTS